MTKPQPAPKSIVDSLLDEVPLNKSKAVLASMPELCDAIRYFLERKLAGDERAQVTLMWFYTHKLKARFGGPGIDAVRKYIREQMRLDLLTGASLDG